MTAADGGSAVPGATVAVAVLPAEAGACDGAATTDAEGRFELWCRDLFVDARLTVTVAAAGYGVWAAQHLAWNCPCDGLRVVLRGPGTPEPQVTPDPERINMNVFGTIVAKSDGKAIAGARVLFGFVNSGIRSDEQGRFRLPYYNAPRHAILFIRIEALGYQAWDWDGSTDRCPCRGDRFELLSLDDPAPEPTHLSYTTLRVRGHVLDAADDQALAGARVHVSGRDTYTDETGWFEFEFRHIQEFARVEIGVQRSGYLLWHRVTYVDECRCDDLVIRLERNPFQPVHLPMLETSIIER